MEEHMPTEIEPVISRMEFKESLHEIQHYVNTHTSEARSVVGLYYYLMLFALVFAIITLGICFVICIPMTVIILMKKRVLPHTVRYDGSLINTLT